ncbi:MAG: hypothetical protein JWM64_508 [Frankiales bacterium]|nr:hypothetical protein [Frankiales bacterium]
MATHLVAEDGRLVEVEIADPFVRIAGRPAVVVRRQHHSASPQTVELTQVSVVAGDEAVGVSVPGEPPHLWVALAPAEVAGRRLGDRVDPARDAEGWFDPTGDVPVVGWLITLVDLVRVPSRLRERRREKAVVADPQRAAARAAARAPAQAALLADLRRLHPEQPADDPFGPFGG